MKKILKLLCLLMMLSQMSGCKIQATKVCGTNYPVYYLINRIGQSYVEPCNLSNNSLIQVADVSDTFEQDIDEAEVIFIKTAALRRVHLGIYTVLKESFSLQKDHRP